MECLICTSLLSESPGICSPPAAKKAKMSNHEKKRSSVLCCTPCGHIFHRVCLQGWLKKQGNCPACRQKFRERSLYPAFLGDDKMDKSTGKIDPLNALVGRGGNNSKVSKECRGPSKVDPSKAKCKDLHQRHVLLTQDYQEMEEKFRQEKERADIIAAQLQSLEQKNANNAANADSDEEEYYDDDELDVEESDSDDDEDDYDFDYYND